MNERSQWNEIKHWSQRWRVFANNIALYVISNNGVHELKSIKVIDNENIYKWKVTILVKSNSLHKAEFVWTCIPHTWRCEVKWIYMIFHRKMELVW
jgi:hypothetical protein